MKIIQGSFEIRLDFLVILNGFLSFSPFFEKFSSASKDSSCIQEERVKAQCTHDTLVIKGFIFPGIF